MRVKRAAALYDIHGNLPALRAALEEVERSDVDLLVFGGDVASGPMPVESIEAVLGLQEKARFIRGNTDRELVAAYDRGDASGYPPAAAWVASRIERRHRDFLASFEERLVVEIEGLGEVLFCHGSPRSDSEVVTSATPESRLRAALSGVDEPVVVCGHTHMQFDRRIDGVRLVNAGSVGAPFGGAAGAYWLLLGPGSRIPMRVL